jgi:hypothetical protein
MVQVMGGQLDCSANDAQTVFWFTVHLEVLTTHYTFTLPDIVKFNFTLYYIGLFFIILQCIISSYLILSYLALSYFNRFCPSPSAVLLSFPAIFSSLLFSPLLSFPFSFYSISLTSSSHFSSLPTFFPSLHVISPLNTSPLSHIPSHRITSHHITSHLTTQSHPILCTPHHSITPYHILYHTSPL